MATVHGKPFDVLESVEADFEQMTWTFRLNASTEVGAGQYAVLFAKDFMAISGKLATAEGLLRQWLKGHLDDGFKERVERHFDPAPL